MDRIEFLKEAFLRGETYRRKKWVIHAFTQKTWDPNNLEEMKQPYDIGVSEGKYCFLKPDGSFEYIEEKGKPIPITKTIFHFKEAISLKRGDVPNLNEDIISTPGNLLINYYCLVSAFGKKVPYQNGQITPGGLGKLVIKDVVDNVPLAQREEGKIYVDEVKRFISATISLSGFVSLAAPSATPFTMTPAPGIKALRQKLLDENRDKLDDPVVVTDIEKQLKAYDKEYLSKDPNGGFYVKKKALDVGRKKVHVIHGLVTNMKGETKLVETSINDTPDLRNFPYLIDELREGSFARGQETALGGEMVKVLIRLFNTSRITGLDCHSKVGLPIDSSEENLKNFMSRTVLFQGKPYLLTEKTLPLLKGKPLQVRSPGFCQEDKEGRNFCLACMGESFKGKESSIGAYASAVGSQIMYLAMKKMHGSAGSSTVWDLNDTLS